MRQKVFQFGDAIAIVAADTEANARAAAEKVKVELEELPAYMSAPAAMAEDAIEIHPGTPNVYYEQKRAKGEDTKPIMESAAHVVEDEFYLQRQPHLTMEPDVGFAYFDEEGRLTIHSKSIGIHLHHAMICPGLGIEPEKLRMVQNPAGGTFGYKFSPTMEALLGVAAWPPANRSPWATTTSSTSPTPASARPSSSSSSTGPTRTARSWPWKATGSWTTAPTRSSATC